MNSSSSTSSTAAAATTEVEGVGTPSPVEPNATRKFGLEKYVRMQQDIPATDPRYHYGNSKENREEPPPEEIAGDIFDRQRCIVGFDQHKIESQRCLVLGTGGIGQNVAINLARLGVSTIILLDNDTYDVTNLTRQLLGGIADIGKRKVDCAAENLKFHNLRSTIEAHHVDAVKQWDIVVELVRRSDVVFNCIDVGSSFDYAVNSLCKFFCVPLIQGQSSGWQSNIEFFSGQPGMTCGACGTKFWSFGDLKTKTTNKFTMKRFDEFRARKGMDSRVDADALYEYVSGDKELMVTGDNTRMILDNFLQDFLKDKSGSGDVLFSQFNESELQGLFDYFAVASEKLLMPDQITNLSEIGFIKQDKHVPTRFIGSWVCVCLMASTMMVSQFARYITGPYNISSSDPNAKYPPKTITFPHETGIDQAFAQSHQLGFLFDLPDMSNKASNSTCKVCTCLSNLNAETLRDSAKKLFFSSIPVHLQNDSSGSVNLYNHASDLCDEIEPPLVYKSTGGGATGGAGGDFGRTLWRNLTNLPKEYDNLALDAIPTVDYEFRTSSDGNNNSNNNSAGGGSAVVMFHNPLVKCKKSIDSIPAFGSGKRSALIQDPTDSTGWIRLKGCGMPDKGFTVVDEKSDRGNFVYVKADNDETLRMRKIRGSCYMHTANNELRMSAYIQQIAHPLGIRVGNYPIGRWDYSSATVDEYPLIPRCCGVFKTLGDKRLGSHVVEGLELLIPLLFSVLDPSERGVVNECVRNAFVGFGSLPEMGIEALTADSFPPDFDCDKTDDFDTRLPQGLLSMALFGSLEQPNLFVEVASTERTVRGLRIPSEDSFNLVQAFGYQNIPYDLRVIWGTCCSRLKAICGELQLDEGVFMGKLYGYLYWRFGVEAGIFQKVLQDNDVCWGAFADSCGNHSNAHANNMILIEEDAATANVSENGKFLAPVDFDMAYTKSSCRFGKSSREEDLSEFQKYFDQERGQQSLIFSISLCNSNGESASTGVKAPPRLPNNDEKLFRVSMRSTLIAGWIAGFYDQTDLAPYEAALKEASYCLLKLALILSNNVIA